jgi:hypothetical protein
LYVSFELEKKICFFFCFSFLARQTKKDQYTNLHT